WGEPVEGQRKPERPAECKALPARRCPYYIVRRSRCGFLTLLLSLYSRESWASRFSSRSGDLRPPFVNVGDLEGPAPRTKIASGCEFRLADKAPIKLLVALRCS